MFWLFAFVVLLCFALVVLFGAPYLPTLKPQVAAALKLADLKPGQTLLELGCGDGRVVIAAAKQGIKVVGYELNPVMAAICWLRTLRYRNQVTVVWGNFWQKSWPEEADAIFTFLLPRFMPRLDQEISRRYINKPIKLVSFAFQIPGKKPHKEKAGVFLYRYDN